MTPPAEARSQRSALVGSCWCQSLYSKSSSASLQNRRQQRRRIHIPEGCQMSYGNQHREAELLALTVLRVPLSNAAESEVMEIITSCRPENLGYLAYQVWFALQMLLENLDSDPTSAVDNLSVTFEAETPDIEVRAITMVQQA